MLNEEKSTGGGKNNKMLVMLVVLIIGGTVGFFGGTKYQQNKTLSQRTQMAGQFGGNRVGGTQLDGTNRAGSARGGQVLGTILSADAKSITVQMQNGSSKIVLISGTTSINQASVATINDLKVGEKVSAFGTPNTDGSVTAQNIQINPIMRDIPSGVPTGTLKK